MTIKGIYYLINAFSELNKVHHWVVENILVEARWSCMEIYIYLCHSEILLFSIDGAAYSNLTFSY